MNMQLMIKQAQKMQSDILKSKEEINQKIFPGKYSYLEIEINGKKEIIKVTIDKSLKISDEEDVEMLEDVIALALKDAINKVDKETEEKLGKYGSGMSGLL
ncbi:MAG: YbaB/EbfC family nucleoid-associated protein [Bacilli bacterium]